MFDKVLNTPLYHAFCVIFPVALELCHHFFDIYISRFKSEYVAANSRSKQNWSVFRAFKGVRTFLSSFNREKASMNFYFTGFIFIIFVKICQIFLV